MSKRQWVSFVLGIIVLLASMFFIFAGFTRDSAVTLGLGVIGVYLGNFLLKASGISKGERECPHCWSRSNLDDLLCPRCSQPIRKGLQKR